ncbi:MAG: phosphatase PAP2 family protein [Candidatus Eremiobacteraeota bacterium]|nr:phosphatase PAP2 family protein [Candidatus Eremiobacteraeota bacterium]MBV9262778.1 phosphatase PAP2 family protein [Candidatus Eremiobacteraeota bacterium]
MNRRGHTLWGAVVAVIAVLLFLALGKAVARAPDPDVLATWEHALAGHGALIAWWLTWSCYVYVLVPIAIALLIVAWRLPAWRSRIIFSLIVLLICWRGADLMQHVFGRPRRLDWIVKHETAFSYPSSHATIAVGFYALWGAMFYLSELGAKARKVVGTLLILLAIAICWARLALGAHYITDVVGGALLAVAIVAAGVAIAQRPVLRPEVAGRVARAAE